MINILENRIVRNLGVPVATGLALAAVVGVGGEMAHNGGQDKLAEMTSDCLKEQTFTPAGLKGKQKPVDPKISAGVLSCMEHSGEQKPLAGTFTADTTVSEVIAFRDAREEDATVFNGEQVQSDFVKSLKYGAGLALVVAGAGLLGRRRAEQPSE